MGNFYVFLLKNYIKIKKTGQRRSWECCSWAFFEQLVWAALHASTLLNTYRRPWIVHEPDNGHERNREDKVKMREWQKHGEQEIWQTKLQADNPFFFLVAFVLSAKHLISRVFRLFQLLLFCDRKQRPQLSDFTSSSPSTHNICSGPATEVMRARTMLSLLNHLICSALSRSVLSDTVAVHQSRHTHTFTRYHTRGDRQKYSPFKCAPHCKDLIQ